MIKLFGKSVMYLLGAPLMLSGCGPGMVRCDKADEGICRELTETSPDSLRELPSVCDRTTVQEGRCPREKPLGVCDNKSIGKVVHYYYSRRGKHTAQDASEECKRMGGYWNESPPRD